MMLAWKQRLGSDVRPAFDRSTGKHSEQIISSHNQV